MKLIHKLIIGFLLVSSLGWMTGYFAVNISRKTLEKAFMGSVEFLAVQILDGIEKDLQNKTELFQEYCGDVMLQKEILNSNRHFEGMEHPEDYLVQRDREWTAVAHGKTTPFMQNLIRNDLSREMRAKTGFYEKKYGYKVFPEVFVTNRYGANIAQTGKTTDYRQDDEDWWQIAKRDGLFIGDVAYDLSAEVYSTDIALRVDDKSGNFIGIMKLVINIEGVFDLIKKIESSGMHKDQKTIEYKIITKDGKLIYSTGDFEFLADINGLVPEPVLSSLRYEPNKVGSVDEIMRNGDEFVITHAHAKGSGDFHLGWILIVEQKAEELFAPAIELRQRILTVSMFVTLMGILIGFLISGHVSRAFKKLIHATARIGDGNLDTRIEIKSGDEIGQLAEAFRRMAENLKATTVRRDELAEEINERKRIEAALKKAHEEIHTWSKELEKRVAEKTEALRTSQAQLIQSEKLSAMGHMAGGLTHELNSPLAGLLPMMKKYRDKEDANTREHKELTLMLNVCEHMARIIRDFGAFSRISKGEYRELSLKEVIEDTLSFCTATLKNGGVRVIKQYAANLPKVRGAKTELQQVVLNILTNAHDAMPEGGELVIKTGMSEDKNNVVMEFTDSGTGIEKENADKIFDPFFTTKKPGEGTGLGLSVSYGIIKKHGGEITLSSKPGRGTKFSVYLPAAASRRPHDAHE